MKSHPILFSGPMVRAILGNRKTQTRRILTKGNSLRDGWGWSRAGYAFEDHDWPGAWVDAGPSPGGNPGPFLKVPLPVEETVHRIYPRWQVGDTLWVRETFCHDADDGGMTAFRADNWLECPSADGKWKPSIFMERKQSRITLEIVSIRVERLQSINEADACAEGVSEINTRELGSDNVIRPLTISAVKCYRSLWNHINGVGSWDANPWVWVLEFRRLPAGVEA